MTDRDRLIKLFEEIEKDPAITCPHYKTDKTCDTCKYTINNFMCNHTERTVDYLLANGVVVLDMSVIAPKNRPLITHIAERPLNDVLELLRAEQEGRIIAPPCDIGQTVYTRYGYSFKIEQIEVLKDKKILFRCGNDGTDDYMAFYDFEIGTDVFLTEEEAEEKLRELG